MPDIIDALPSVLSLSNSKVLEGIMKITIHLTISNVWIGIKREDSQHQDAKAPSGPLRKLLPRPSWPRVAGSGNVSSKCKVLVRRFEESPAQAIFHGVG